VVTPAWVRAFGFVAVQLPIRIPFKALRLPVTDLLRKVDEVVMIGIILAIALSTQCVVTGEDRSGILLSCDDTAQTELRIPISEWPQQWHGPELGFAYEIDAQGQPIPSKPNPVALRQVYDNSLREGRRWRRPATQQVRRTP
jgi:hypothetical protein